MPHWRPLVTAATATVLAGVLVIGTTGGHSPFAAPAPGAQQPVADDVAAATATPGDQAALGAGDPTASPTPDATHADATPRPAPRSRSSGANGGTGGAGAGGGTTANPTPGATPRPTPRPTVRPAPTPRPTPPPTATPSPAPASPVLHVDDGAVLAWTTCASSAFAAYAVVRSTDSEIHYPAEDHDTVVALVTARGSTSLTDTGAPDTRVWYAVWCLSRSDGEYQTIWKTPTVSYSP